MDNASVIAAVLHLLREFSRSGTNLEFVLFGAEELGFWGSRRYVERRLGEIDRIEAVVCLDGLCSDKGLVEIGVSESLKPFVEALAKEVGIRVDKWSVPPRPNSDHVPFVEAGVPVVWLTTMDPYYHTAGDVPANISRAKLERTIRFAKIIVQRLVERGLGNFPPFTI
ncbi:M20/M25/M40 family metallo-hydrolase [Moorellaceae bacterium AZ2]